MTQADGTTRRKVAGACTALVTPFRAGRVDVPRLEQLVDRQLAAGIDWVVPCGTTGESPTLTDKEHDLVLETVMARVAGRCGVLAGTGSNDTAEAVRRTRHAAQAGADAAMLVAPYYNRPSAEGLFRHYAAVAEQVDLPLVLYNVPARTGVNIPNDVVVRLRANFKHVVALKHATGSVVGVTELLERCDINVLSGDDSLTWPLMALGAVGLISVVSNLVPELVVSLVRTGQAGRRDEVLPYHRRVHELAEGLGHHGPNPVPIKTALALSGLLEEEFRLPLCPLPAEARAEIRMLLQRFEIPLPAASTA